MTGFLESQLDYIYFFYGLAFILMAQACFTIRKSRGPGLPWVRLGLFGVLHGLNEWLDLAAMTFGDGTAFSVSRALILTASFLLLIEFGRAGTLNLRGRGPGRWVFLPLLLLAGLGGISGIPGLSASIRYSLGLTGGLWAAYALFTASRARGTAGRGWLMSASAAMAVYAVFAGVIPASAPFFPASTVSSESFFNLSGVPVQLLRGLLAVWTAVSITVHAREQSRLAAEQEYTGAGHVHSLKPVFAVLGILALGWVLTEAIGKYAERTARQDLLSKTMTAAAGINPERVARLTGTPADAGTPDFVRLNKQLQAICDANCRIYPEWSHKLCRYVYLMGLRDGKLIFLVDGEQEGSKDYQPPGRVYEDTKPYQVEDYRNARVTVQGPLTDSWGSWVSGVAPILGHDGRVLAQVGMDIEARQWLRNIYLHRFLGLVATLAFYVMSMALLTAWRRSRESSAQRAALEVASVRLENEKRLRDIAAALGEGILVKDGQGRLTFMNPEAERLLGWSEAELRGKFVHDAIHHQNADGTKKHKEDCLSYKTLTTGKTFRDDTDVFTRKDGTTFPMSYVTSPIMENGRVAGAVTAFQDITERKEAEKEKDRLIKAVSATTEGIAFTDEKERYVYMNEAHARIFGYTPQELLGRTWRAIVTPEAATRIEEAMQGELHGKGAGEVGGEAEGRKKDGSVIPVEFKLSGFINEVGGYAGHVCIARDITERKKVESEIKRGNDLLYSISRIQSQFIESQGPPTLFEEILGRFLALTDSEYGFIGEVLYDPDNKPYLRTYAITNIAWDDETRSFYDKNYSTGMEFHNLKTLFGHVMTVGEPVISNSPSTEPRRGGLPDGHPPLNSFLGLPLSHGDTLVGMVGMANRPGGYDPALVDYMKPLLTTSANILAAYRNEWFKKQVEDLLRKSEEKYRNLVELTTDIICISDKDGNLAFMNDTGYSLLGYSPSEVIGRPWSGLIHQDDRERSDAKLSRMVKEGRFVFNFENRYVSKDGRSIHVLHNIRVLRSEGGEVVGTQGIARDITERKLAEEALTERARLAALGADIGVALTQVSDLAAVLKGCAEAMVSHLDAAFARIWTYNEEEDVLELKASAGMYTHTEGAHGRVPLHGTKVGHVAAERRAVMTNNVIGDPLVTDQEWARREGMVAFAGHPLVVEDKVVGVMAMFSRRPFSDTTLKALASVADEVAIGIERKAVEGRLRLFSEAVEEAPDGIQIVDLEGRVIYSNKAFGRIFGYPPEECIGKHVNEFHADPGFAATNVIPGMKTTGSWVGEPMMKRKDGTTFPVWLTTSMVKDKNGRPIAMVGITRDITDRKNLERQRADFYAMVTHDLKSPLTAILGYLDLILSDEKGMGGKDTLEMMESIRKSSLKLSRMVEDFLVVSRLEYGSVSLNESVVDVSELCKEVCGEYEVLARQKGVEFKSEAAPDLPKAILDRMHVYRAVSNLLQNAVNYTPRGGSITVKAYRGAEDDSDFIVISVTDTGPGIPADEVEKIFDKYYRSPRSAGIKGSGLGLAVVKSVASAHDGRVELTTKEGEGSTFSLFLPVRRHEQQAPSPLYRGVQGKVA